MTTEDRDKFETFFLEHWGWSRSFFGARTRAAPHLPLEVFVPVPAPNRRSLQRCSHPCFDTPLSDGTERCSGNHIRITRKCEAATVSDDDTASSSCIVKVLNASISQFGGPITGVSVPHRM
jgi:hypothetical protein